MLQALPPEHSADLAKLGVLRQYKAGVLILQEGELGDAFHLLVNGKVQALSRNAAGKEIIFNKIQTGEYFGEMSLDGGLRSANIEALTDCECILIPNARVLDYASAHADFSLHLLHTTIKRARAATDAARNMALQDVYERLWVITDKEFNANNNVCHLTHQQLAMHVGASREMVSKLLKDLSHGGYIEAQRREIKRLRKIPKRW
jgi:CRP/FNR family cyclic AMP-dependent transcriptional regulator